VQLDQFRRSVAKWRQSASIVKNAPSSGVVFREFPVDCFVWSRRTQKQSCRTLQELSTGI